MLTGLNIGHQGTRWMHIKTFPHPTQAAITEQQHTDPRPNPAHPTKAATAQQAGRQHARLQF